MKVSAQRVVRNTTGYFFAMIFRKGLTLIYFTLIARFRDLDTTGIYYLLVAYATIFGVVVDLGLTQVLVREGSKHPEQLERYVRTILMLKIGLAVGGGMLASVLVNLLGYPPLTRELVYIIVCMGICEAMADAFYACSRAHHQMAYESLGLVIGQTLTLVLGGIALWVGASVHFLLGALVVNQLFNACFAYYYAQKWPQLHIGFAWDPVMIKHVLFIAVPFAVSMFFKGVLSADTIILRMMADHSTIALFSIPSTVLSTLQFIPLSLTTALFATLSYCYLYDQVKLQRTFRKLCQTLMHIGVPIGVSVFIFAEELILLIFGPRFVESALALRIFISILIPVFLVFGLSSLLDACNRQVTNTVIMTLSAAVHLLLSALLIPHYGTLGIAIGACCGYSGAFIACLWCARGILGTMPLDILADLWRVVIAGGTMGVVLLLVRSTFPWLLAMGFGVLAYIVTIGLVNGLSSRGFDRNLAYGEWLSLAKHVLTRGT